MGRERLGLDVIEVREPCTASWESMRGDDRMRFCEGCGRHVRNLSAMTRDEAVQLLEGCAKGGPLCVRFARSADGVVQTLDYRRAPLRRGRGWRFWAALGASLATGIGAINAVVFRSSLPFFRRPQPTMVMGALPARVSPGPTSGSPPVCGTDIPVSPTAQE